MRMISRFFDPSMRAKLLLLNLMIFIIFGIISIIAFTAFTNIKNITTTIIDKDVWRIIRHAQLGKELDGVLDDTNQLISSFYRNELLLATAGEHLSQATWAIVRNTSDRLQASSLGVFHSRLRRVLQQCARVNKVSRSIDAIEQELNATLSELEGIISEKIVDLVLAGEDSMTLRQLAALIPSYRETLLQTFLYLARAEPVRSNPEDTRKITGLLDDLHLRLHTILASDAVIADYGRRLLNGVADYKKLVVTFDSERKKLQENLAAMNSAKEQATAVMRQVDVQLIDAAKLLKRQTSAVMKSTISAVYWLSGVVVLAFGIFTYVFLLFAIRRPMESIRRSVISISEGNLDLRIRLNRTDEWKSIEDALNKMVEDLGESYAGLQLKNRQLETAQRQMKLHMQALEVEIEQRTKAEGALRESRETFRALVESAPFGLAILDPDGSFDYFNPEFERTLGYSLADIPNKEVWFEKAYPDEEFRNRVIAAWREYRSANPAVRGPSERVGEVRCKDGRTKTIKFRNVDLEDGRQVVVYEDISSRVKAEAALVDSEKRYRELYRQSSQREQLYRSLLNSTPDAVAILNLDGETLYINPAFEKIFGFSAEEVIGRPIPFVPAGEEEKTRSEIERVLRSRSVSTFETRRLTKDGGVLDVMLSSSCYHDHEGKLGGVLVILRDVTQSKKVEQQLLHAQKMEAIGTLAGGVAHDFNNLLQAIHGYAELLLLDKTEADSGFREYQEILGAARRGSDLTRQLLTFSRKVESQPRPISINHEVREVEKILRRTIPKMVEIELRLVDDLSIVNADPGQLEQVLLNLALNAKDAMPDGGRLVIETRDITVDEVYSQYYPGLPPGDFVLIRVSDNGAGMDEETLEHVFEPFYTTKETGRGTGLGLAMVYGIVENHGGHITCHSEIDSGTTFEIYLPAEQMAQPPLEAAFTETLPGGDETILLVDDDKAVRDLAERILTRFGYTVLLADNGEQALQLFRHQREGIDLILLDLIMPGMGGRQCLEKILELDPEARVVIISGYAAQESTEGIIAIGARDFINKPYNYREMLEIIRSVLDES